jgi:hypothetical protein
MFVYKYLHIEYNVNLLFKQFAIIYILCVLMASQSYFTTFD